MSLNKLILNFFLKIVDILTFFVKRDPLRITFVSLTQDHMTSDFYWLDKALEKENKYHIHYNLLVFEKNLWGDFTYFLNCLKQLVDLKKSALVIINDNNYVISHCKPKGTKVLQIWHACGAVKKFGNEIHRQYPIANYDVVLANSPIWKKIYSKSFGVKENQVIVTGMPRTDELLNEEIQNKNKKNFYEKYPACKNKKLILYAPTFRGNIIDGLSITSFDFEKVENALPEEYIILYKFHPLLGNIKASSHKSLNVNEEDLYTLMEVSECLISDYSSIIFDYSLLNKPMIAYIPDFVEYKENIGLNINLQEEFPGPICYNDEQLINALLHLDVENIYAFQKKYMIYSDGDNTQRVIRYIHQMMSSQ